jgi:hypothetical protein
LGRKYDCIQRYSIFIKNKLIKVVALSEVNRMPIKLLNKIEEKICHNLGMEYEINTISDILFTYA